MHWKIGKFIAAVAVPAIAGFMLPSSAEAVVVRDGLNGYDGTQDAAVFIHTSSTTNNHNWGGLDRIFSANSSNRFRYLISFDLSHLAGQTVTSATLRLTKWNVSIAGDGTNKTISAFEINSANAGWVQGSGTGALASDGWVTGNNKAHNVSPWNDGNKIGSGTTLADSVADATAGTMYRDDDAPGTTYDLTLPLALIQSWIDSPAANAGLFFANDGGATQVIIASSEFTNNGALGDASWRPTLFINQPVPEPTSLAVLGVAGLFLAARRRRQVIA